MAGAPAPERAGDWGLFGPDSVTWRVHVEPVMWVAGFRALFLQSLHPRVMRGTYQNSALLDPGESWARFQRTTEFVSVRTFGTAEEVERAGRRVRAIHASRTGYDPDSGTTFPLDDPECLLWVHCGEIDSYVTVARRAGILTDTEADRYVSESRRAAEVVGIPAADAPGSRADLAAYYERVRPHLYACREARMGLLKSFNPALPAKLTPLKLAAPPFNSLAFASLPRWARRMYGAPGLPTTDLAATVAVRALRETTSALPDLPAPPRVDRARHMVRERQAGPRTPASPAG